jgi:signal transduction histidine kinase
MNPDRLPPDQATCVRGIRDETDALGEVVTNFLNFARPAPLTLTRVDLDALVTRVAEEIRDDLSPRGGEVVVSGSFPEIDGDEILIRQALSNLARNAAEASAANPSPRVWVHGGTADLGACRIVVADNGPGIDPAIQDRIFQPFFTTRSNGTGLGLALVQKIVVTHNGRVTVGARAGGGASFEVVLPLRHQAAVG